MDSAMRYADKLKADMIEQFKGRPNSEALLEVLGGQLDEVAFFFEQLNIKRHLKNADGVQLDSIGDIVQLTRYEAYVISRRFGLDVPMGDETYRDYLAYKIFLNTNDCTHKGVYKALTWFWKASPLYYREEIGKPATIFFDTPALKPEDDAARLLMLPKIKAAGVGIWITAHTVNPASETSVYIAGHMASYSSTELPLLEPRFDGGAHVHTAGFAANVTVTRLPLPEAGEAPPPLGLIAVTLSDGSAHEAYGRGQGGAPSKVYAKIVL